MNPQKQAEVVRQSILVQGQGRLQKLHDDDLAVCNLGTMERRGHKATELLPPGYESADSSMPKLGSRRAQGGDKLHQDRQC